MIRETVEVQLRRITGVVTPLKVPPSLQTCELYRVAAAALNMPDGQFKLVLHGAVLSASGAAAAARAGAIGGSGTASPSTVTSSGNVLVGALRERLVGGGSSGAGLVQLTDKDILLVVPQRAAPSAALQRAAAAASGRDLDGRGGSGRANGDEDDDDDDAPLRLQLPSDAPHWHVVLARTLKTWGVPELALVWLFALGPGRLATAAALLVSARLVAVLYDPQTGGLLLLLGLITAICCNLGVRREGEASAYSIFNEGVRRLPGQLDADEVDRQIRAGHF